MRLSSANDTLTLAAVAIKKIPEPFRTLELAKRTFRELKLLRHLRHDNVGLRSILKTLTLGDKKSR